MIAIPTITDPALVPTDIEQVLVGTLLNDSNAVSRAARKLKPEHFGDPDCRLVYEHCLKLWRSGKAVDIVTVQYSFVADGEKDPRARAIRNASYSYRVASSSHLEDHADIILDYFRRRSLAHVARVIDGGIAGHDDTTAVVARIMAEVESTSIAGADDDLSGADVAYELMNTAPPNPIYLDMGDLDDKVYILPGNIVTIKGEAGSGKTAFMVSAMLNVLPRIKTWVVSLEMNPRELMMRSLCQLAQTDIALALQDRLHPDDKDRLVRAASDNAAMLDRFRIDPAESMGLDEFRAKAEHMVKHSGVGLIVLDYAQLVDADHTLYPKQVQQLEAISKGLRATARKLNTPILVVVHVNKDGAEHGSIQFEKDAHIRLSIEREQGSDKMTVHILKNRNGNTGRATLNCRFACGMVGRTHPPHWTASGTAIVPITGLPIRGSAGTPHETPIADEPF